MALVATVLAGWAFGGVGAPAQGGLLVAVSVVFTVADFFLWKTMDSLGDLPNAPELTHIEAGRLNAKIEDLRGRLISRWFFMLGAKLAVAAMGVLLMKEVAVGVPLQWFWWGGVFLIFLSLQMALTFVSNWRQADKAKRMGVLAAPQAWATFEK